MSIIPPKLVAQLPQNTLVAILVGFIIRLNSKARIDPKPIKTEQITVIDEKDFNGWT